MSETTTVFSTERSSQARPSPIEALQFPAEVPIITIEALTERLTTYLEHDAITEVQRAFFYAQEAHEGQFRKTGHPYITHPTAVADILAGMHMDHQTLMAALLHDVIEDTGVRLRTLRTRFGPEVASIVDGVSKLTTIFHSQAEAQAENFQKIALATAKDIRVILVKLADRLHNMRTLGALPGEKRKHVARETLDFYAPIANRLGMHELRVEFEELGFVALYPMRAARISHAVRAVRRDREELVNEIRQTLANALAADGIEATVVNREKHLYSIYRKMQEKRKFFSEMMDAFTFRIITDQADTCYRVLGTVHSLYKPVTSRFKDYIAIPKANGYQSLHTTLFGIHGAPIEIQIRTRQMDAVAANGIASRWLYNSGDKHSTTSSRGPQEWAKSLRGMQQLAGSSLEFIEHLKVDLFPDEIHVFTPKGLVLTLPEGASPVDFAYAVHTDIGNSCVGCHIDRRLSPLSVPLQNGQTIEIITSENSLPDPNWHSFVVTAKAHASIRYALRRQRVSASRALGRRMLNQSLKSAGTSLRAIPRERMEAVLKELGVAKLDTLLQDIGLGNRMAYAIALCLADSESRGDGADEAVPTRPNSSPLAIHGAEGLAVTYSHCCRPLPGDPIVGYMSSGHGLIVHLERCRGPADLRSKQEEMIPVRWAEQIEGEFATELRLEVAAHKGVIAKLTAAITAADASIQAIDTKEHNARLSAVIIKLRVCNRTHLAHIMRRLRRLTPVISLSRHRNA